MEVLLCTVVVQCAHAGLPGCPCNAAVEALLCTVAVEMCAEVLPCTVVVQFATARWLGGGPMWLMRCCALCLWKLVCSLAEQCGCAVCHWRTPVCATTCRPVPVRAGTCVYVL